MQVEDSPEGQVIYIMVELPPRWEIQPETEKKFGVTIGNDGVVYYFCAALEQGFDVIFDAIDYNIEKMKLVLERTQLFRQKAKELQDLFADESITLDVLKTLDFTYRGKKKKQLLPPKPVDTINNEEEQRPTEEEEKA